MLKNCDGLSIRFRSRTIAMKARKRIPRIDVKLGPPRFRIPATLPASTLIAIATSKTTGGGPKPSPGLLASYS